MTGNTLVQTKDGKRFIKDLDGYSNIPLILTDENNKDIICICNKCKQYKNINKIYKLTVYDTIIEISGERELLVNGIFGPMWKRVNKLTLDDKLIRRNNSLGKIKLISKYYYDGEIMKDIPLFTFDTVEPLGMFEINSGILVKCM